jgi:predicted nucleic acid-binding protein
MPAIADSSYVVSVILKTDTRHEACKAVHARERLVYLPQSTLAEVAYLLTKHIGNRGTALFLHLLPQSKYRLVALMPEDIVRTAEILNQYADTRVDFVDATIAAVAERLKITRILSLDQRDFRVIRPKHSEYFEILPSS